MVAVFSMKRGGVEGHEVIDGVEVHYIGPLITMTCPGGAFDVGSLLAAVRGETMIILLMFRHLHH
ncbi:MAG TPA: hypothetical protein GXX31_01370 [Methanothermobacter sp.]|uniref:Uncharacterized protein n=1 Tax=Methanothermobacter tenebrarum TaxID=680118 RepID=A0ABN6PB57_9EURY|nr:hypothetical protein [Methanothermobacter tenebrarum]MBK6586532.1 hypothetical protein [Coprothermobacter sp.]MDI6881574.1 hypothetical protein [Methanothermobacter sp.]BDH79455.1 hypothetical protein MTTB_08340 [Methanothermobacter tenebrarum]HHW16023.1 hypothetical protein [Methanothermobacter sp.]HOQ19457.1 hypothetical protein [Methanothermobacter sp.]